MPTYYNYSQIINHNRCKFSWQVAYQRRIEPLTPKIRMDLGSAVHAGLAAYWMAYPTDNTSTHSLSHTLGIAAIEGWADELLPGWRDVVLDYEEEMEALDKVLQVMDENPDAFSPDDILSLSIAPIVERAKEIFTRTVKFIGDSWEVIIHEGAPVVEREFVYKNVLSHIDLAVRDKASGMLMVVDFKVRKSIQPDEASEFDLQTALYQIVMRGNGINIGATALFQVRSITPRQPRMNKDGKAMSRSDIITDWATYQAALIANGLDPSDYGDMAMKLANKKFFAFDRVYRGEERLNAIWEKVVQPSIRELKLSERRYKGGTIPAARNMSTFNCASCRVRLLCMAELEGMDTSHMMGTLFDYKDENDGK